MTLFQKLLIAINQREPEWGFKEKPSILFRACELGGEAGEALNEVKKLERHRLGAVGGKASSDDLADELADVIICAALVAREAGINLDDAVVRKFNKTSSKHGMMTRMS